MKKEYGIWLQTLFFLLSLYHTSYISLAQRSKIDSLFILLKKDKEDTSKVNHLNKLSWEYRSIGSYDSSIAFAHTALKLAQQLNPPYKKGIASAYNNIGTVYREQGDYPKALDYYLKGLSVSEQLEQNVEPNLKSKFLGNIGVVYWHQGDYSKALDYYFKALKMAEESGYKQLQANAIANIGIVYWSQGNYSKALEYHFKAQKMYEALGMRNDIAANLSNIGVLYEEQKDYPQALNYYFKALKMAEEIGNKNGIAIRLGNIGSLYTIQKKYKEAEKYLLKALSIDKEIRAMDSEMQREESLTELYTKTNRHQLALKHYKRAMMLKDSIFNEEKDKEITRKEMNYEFEKKESQTKAEYDKEMMRAEASSQRKSFIIYLLAGMSVTLCLIILTVVLFYRQNKLKAEQKVLKMEQKLLRLQMNPHFIFNSLAAVQGFINTDRKNEAGIYLAKISTLIRAILENSRQEYIPFEKELQCLENYLTVNQLLMDNQFDYKIEVDERIDREQTTIPPMIAQPFIENALKHGIQNKQEKGFIIVRFKKDNQSMLFEVEDNGIGLTKIEIEGEPKHQSLATLITTERLANLCRVSLDKIKINMDEVKNSIGIVSGTKVNFEIPVKYA